MEKILVDIREENESIRDYFKNKDLVSVDDLLNAIDDLICEKDNLEEKLEDQEEEPDAYKMWRDLNGTL